jgi:nitrate reductase NapAB chaperone NapD
MAQLGSIAGCEAVLADNRDLIALVTETADDAGETALRRALGEIDGIFALVLTFGELDDRAAAS